MPSKKKSVKKSKVTRKSTKAGAARTSRKPAKAKRRSVKKNIDAGPAAGEYT